MTQEHRRRACCIIRGQSPATLHGSWKSPVHMPCKGLHQGRSATVRSGQNGPEVAGPSRGRSHRNQRQEQHDERNGRLHGCLGRPDASSHYYNRHAKAGVFPSPISESLLFDHSSPGSSRRRPCRSGGPRDAATQWGEVQEEEDTDSPGDCYSSHQVAHYVVVRMTFPLPIWSGRSWRMRRPPGVRTSICSIPVIMACNRTAMLRPEALGHFTNRLGALLRAQWVQRRGRSQGDRPLADLLGEAVVVVRILRGDGDRNEPDPVVAVVDRASDALAWRKVL